ncbi:DoxX family membrane protein [Gordonia polyisoprenivorans]|uniref:DoxX family membrane protein n=1 Tax=Gordonia polyisoprenivorans TaxID=84595 RepID=UPI001B8D0557|nr:DoxX family membrane protein [Gordonia polyisoprenivorans]QUD85603.1 DoxX family membrane protein [Gordonia polyisoprenivorans]
MILRRIARPMLATVFIALGVDALRKPTGRAEMAGDFIESSLNALPENVSAAVPHDPELLVRINGAVQVGGGLLLATGKFPRIAALGLAGSLVPTTFAGHPFWQETDPVKRNLQRTQFLKNVSLAGGLLIAAADTEGKPSLAWRGKRKASAATAAVTAALPVGAKAGSSAWDSIVERTHEGASVLGEKSEEAAELLRDRAPELTEAARERSTEWADKVRDRAPELAEAARERSTEWADKVRDRAPELAEAARERSTEWADKVRDRAPELAEAARERSTEWAEKIGDRSAEVAELIGDRAPELADSAKSLAATAQDKAEAGRRRWRKAVS